MKTSFDNLIISNVSSKQRKEIMLIYVKRTKDLIDDFVLISEARVASLMYTSFDHITISNVLGLPVLVLRLPGVRY